MLISSPEFQNGRDILVKKKNYEILAKKLYPFFVEDNKNLNIIFCIKDGLLGNYYTFNKKNEWWIQKLRTKHLKICDKMIINLFILSGFFVLFTDSCHKLFEFASI